MISGSSVEIQDCCFCFSWKLVTLSTASIRAATSASSTWLKALSISSALTSRAESSAASRRSKRRVSSSTAASPRWRTSAIIPRTTCSTSRPVSSPRERIVSNRWSKSLSRISRKNIVHPALAKLEHPLQPLYDFGNSLVLGLQAGPVNDQSGSDLGNGLHLHQAVLL